MSADHGKHCQNLQLLAFLCGQNCLLLVEVLHKRRQVHQRRAWLTPLHDSNKDQHKCCCLVGIGSVQGQIFVCSAVARGTIQL